MTAIARRVDTVLASAGTGKTTYLVRSIVEAISNGVAPDRIIATTFTRKAAREIVERLSGNLPRTSANTSSAADVRIGTINAICGQLCREFAFELGMSPNAVVMDEGRAEAMFHAASSVSVADWAPVLNPVADRLGTADQRTDWRAQVFAIVKLAQAHGIPASALKDMARRSSEGLLALLPSPETGSDQLDADLASELLRVVEKTNERTILASSRAALHTVRECSVVMAKPEPLAWFAWAKLADLQIASRDAPLFADVRRVASLHASHPRLRADLERFTEWSFACAADAMDAYGLWKADRGLLDFEDQESLALAVLQEPRHRTALRERIGLVVVDEMQDCSPMQIGILNALAEVAERSVWVGDPKQSIFGFRSTDARLSAAAAKGAAARTGGSVEVLSTSWRSRPGIRAFIADCFLPAFGSVGLRRDEVAFSTGGRSECPSGRPPLAVWRVAGKARANQAAGVAGGIAAALASPEEWPVETPEGLRPLEPGDIAVLCRGNEDVAAVVAAISKAGVPAAGHWSGLFDTPEGRLARAAIRWVADRGDRLALAEMARLTGGDGRSAAWLDALAEEDMDAVLAEQTAISEALERVREDAWRMTVQEAVDAILISGRVHEVALSWGGGEECKLLLEGIRGLAREYEDICARDGSPSGLLDFAGWLGTQGGSHPREARGDAVHVLTYHRSKGLEWPMAVCCQLDAAVRISLFKPTVEAMSQVDWRDPMGGRWIRHWPWPYGRLTRGVELGAAAGESEVGRQAEHLARHEATRLLYVGMTRPRDYLVLIACPERADAWLATLDIGFEKIVELPRDGAGSIMVSGHAHPARCVSVGPARLDRSSGPTRYWASASLGQAEFPPLRTSPSAATASPGARIVGSRRLGTSMSCGADDDMKRLGSAVHAFLGADDPGIEGIDRRGIAASLLEGWHVAKRLKPEDLLRMADRLWAWVRTEFPTAEASREVPVSARSGHRTTVGRLDLLLHGPDFFVVIEHKVYAGGFKGWEPHLGEHAAQLAAYAASVRQATGLRCAGTFVHLPLEGIIAEVSATPLTNRVPGRRRIAPFGAGWTRRAEPIGQPARRTAKVAMQAGVSGAWVAARRRSAITMSGSISLRTREGQNASSIARTHARGTLSPCPQKLPWRLSAFAVRKRRTRL